MEMLGERIRKLRKQKKMTLEALAGKELTKGMLSLIENNKANPSMESLSYIAAQLGIEVSELLEDVSSLELRELLEKVERLFHIEQQAEVDNEQFSLSTKTIIELVKPYALSLSHGYESARLLDIYSRCLFYNDIEGWQEYLDKAAYLYEQLNMTSYRVAIGILRSMDKFTEHDYEQSLSILLTERASIEAKHTYIDPKTRLDLDYHEAILHFAVGDSESATKVMESAITFSKENRIFYRIDDLYRLAASQAMMVKDEGKKEYYSMKLKQYGEFADDNHAILFYHLMEIESLNTIKEDYNQALEQIEKYLFESERYKPFFLLSKGKALYGVGRIEESLQCLEEVVIPSYTHHPFDFSLLYVMDSYKALCYLKMDNYNKAIQLAQKALSNFEILPQTSFKDFASETFDLVQEKINTVNQAET